MPTMLFRTAHCALLALAFAAASSVPAAPVVRILPIGDSITQGGHIASEYTYRLPLRGLLSDEGVQADYIGSRTAGLDPEFRWPAQFDPQHEGYYGQKTRAVVTQVEAHLPQLAAPDVALVHLGTNDSGWKAGFDVVAPLQTLIADLRRRNARVVVLVALPIKSLRDGGSLLRLQLRLMASAASTQASPVAVVDQSSPSQRPATFDGVHPSPEGQRQMAVNWLAAMRQFVPQLREAQTQARADRDAREPGASGGSRHLVSVRAGAGMRSSPRSP